MPFPWKKTKCNRISQLVADHLHSPKRGRSLVVETGFPTSLIDLFVKNHDRLKKPPKKKRTTVPDMPSPTPSSLTPLPSPSSPLNSLSSTVLSSSNDSVCELANPRRCSITSRIGNEIVVGNVVSSFKPSSEVGVGDTVDEEGVELADANRVFVAVLKMFFVVILALGTKKFVVGITMSAFLLFFLEYVGKHIYRLWKPCSDAQKTLKSMVRRVLLFVRIKQDKLIVEEEISRSKAPMGQEECIVSDCSGLVVSHDLNDPIGGIQIVKTMSNLVLPVEEIQSVKEKLDTKKWGCEEMDEKKWVMEKEDDYRCEVLGLKSRRSRSAKLKSKMKKLVPKKLRGSKKKCLNSKNEEYSPMGGEDEVAIYEGQEVDKDGEQCEWDYDCKSLLSSGRHGGQEVDAICSSGEFSQEDVKTIVTEEVGREAKKNSRYLVLCLIVLIGLVGGRILALLLTLLWCLMFKSCETLRRYIKVPLIRSS